MTQKFFRKSVLSQTLLLSNMMIATTSSMEVPQENTNAEHLPVVLSLDGGGIRGIFQVHLLQHIEKALKLDQQNKPIYDYVDCFSGTSIGGINIIGVASKITLNKIKKIYTRAQEKIFIPEPWSLWGTLKYKYKASGLKNTLIKLVGKDTPFSRIEKPVSIVSYDTKVCRTIHFNNWEENYQELKLWDIGLATSAAPHYFPSHLLQNNTSCMDGGLGENNPVLRGIDSAYRTHPNADPIVISMGTGRVQEPLTYQYTKNMSVLGLGENILNMMFNANSSAMDDHAQKRCKPENYFRFQFDLAPGHEGIDDYEITNLEYLCKEADKIADGDLFQNLIEKLIKNQQKKKK